MEEEEEKSNNEPKKFAFEESLSHLVLNLIADSDREICPGILLLSIAIHTIEMGKNTSDLSPPEKFELLKAITEEMNENALRIFITKYGAKAMEENNYDVN